MKLKLVFIPFLFLLLTIPVQARDIETEAKEIETELIAPCCWTQPISEHDSGVSDEMKTNVRQMLRDGKSRQEILDFYVAEYGLRILSVPPQEGFNRLSYLMPILFVLTGVIVIGVVLYRWQHNQTPVPVAAGPAVRDEAITGLDDALSQRIERELQNMD